MNNDDAFASAATADASIRVHIVCLFMKTHLLLQEKLENCLDLVPCVFLLKFSGYVRDITACCQHLQRPFWLLLIYIGETQILT